MHQPRHRFGRVRVLVIREALYERAGAVADTGDREADGGTHRYVSFGPSVLRSFGFRSAHRLGACVGEGRTLRGDERVEPVDVPGYAAGGVLDDGTGVRVQIGPGTRFGLAEPL